MIVIEIFKLFGSIFVDNEKANKSISATDKKAQGLTAKLGNGIKTAAKWGAAIGAGAAVAGGALLAVANKAAATTDNIDKMSQKLGLSRQAYQEWDFILSQNGASIDSLGAGMKTLTNQVDELGKGGKVATDSFGALGLSYEDLAGKSQEEIFEMTVVALQSVEDTTKRAAIANDLLGRSGQELAPLLNAGADSVANMKKQAHDLGLVMNDQAIDAGVKYTDTIDQLKRSFGTIFTVIGTTVMPIMQQLSEWVIANMPIIQAVFSTVFGVIETVVSTAINWISAFIDWIKQWKADNEEQLESIKILFESLFEAIKSLIDGFISFATWIWTNYGEEITVILTAIWDAISTIFDTALNVITDIFNVFASIFRGDWSGAWEGIKKIFVDVWEGIKQLVPMLLKGLYSALKGSFKILKDIGKKMFEGIWEGMKSIWSSICNWVSDKVNWLVDKLAFWRKGSNEMDDGGGGSGNPNLSIGSGYANGTNYATSGWHWVGEKGRELVNFRGGEQVISNDKLKTSNIDYKRLGAEIAVSVYDAIIDANKQKDSKEIKLQVDGKTLARVLMPNLTSENQRLGVSTA